MDLLGEVLRLTGPTSFPGKGRLIQHWMSKRNSKEKRFRSLTRNAAILCDFAIPYEAMVWLKQEEEQELTVLQKLLLPGQVFVDCGANIGLWSIVASDSVGPAGKVYAFEPNPMTAAKFSQNLSSANIKNIQLSETAVADKCGELLLQAEEAHNQARVVASPGEKTIPVRTITLDSLLDNIRVDACKIDIEGYELNALIGGQEMLRKYKPWLCVEFNTILSQINRLDQWPVHLFLTELGYRARLFTDALEPTAENVLDKNWTTKGYCNLYYSIF